jgi:hypothetical protein
MTMPVMEDVTPPCPKAGALTSAQISTANMSLTLHCFISHRS